MKILLALTAAAAITGAASAAQDADADLVGVWDGEDWVMTITPHGYMAAATKDGMVAAILQYTAEGGQVTARDVSPPPNSSAEAVACGMENDAVFTYAMDADEITFSIVSDPCESRAEAIDGTVLTRRAMPAAE
jgi:hypothetical protein